MRVPSIPAIPKVGGRGVGPPTPGWLPTTALGGGCTTRLWCRADAALWQVSDGTTAVATDTDPVGQWPDLSGQGNHLIQAVSGSRPLFRTGIAGVRPMIQFNGTAAYLLNDALAAYLTGSDAAFTLLVAARMTGTGSGQVLMGGGRSTSNTPRQQCQRTGLGPLSFRSDDAGSSSTATATNLGLSTTAATTITYRFTGTQVGIQIGNGAMETFAHDVGTMTLNQLTFGALRRTTTGSFYAGYLGEIIFVSGAMIAGDLALAQAYMGR